MPRTIQITTLTTAAVAEPDGGADMCEVNRTCEGVFRIADRPGRYYGIGTAVTDPAELAAFRSRIGPGEVLFTVDAPIIDGIPR